MNGTTSSGGVTIQSSSAAGLTLYLPPESQAGIKSANNVYIGSANDAPGNQPLLISGTGGGSIATFILEATGSPGGALIQANGPVSVTLFSLGSGSIMVPNASGTPDNLQFSSASSSIDISNCKCYSHKTMTVTAATNASTGVMACGNSTTAGNINIISGSWTSESSIRCQGPIYATISGAVELRGHAISAVANGDNDSIISIQAGDNLTIDDSTMLDAAGEIDIWIGTTFGKTNNYPAIANSVNYASQVSESSGGNGYWGVVLNNVIVDADGTAKFTAAGNDLVFYAGNATNTIGSGATFNAHT
jgi:hypothetical protein